jgi:hypothetical protein
MDGFIELFFTRKNASWWNAIEQIFAVIQKKVLNNNSSFKDVIEMKHAVKNRLPEPRARLKELLEIKGGRFGFAFHLWKEMTAAVPLYCR